MRPRYHCLHFQILHAIYSQFSSLTSLQPRRRPNPQRSFKNGRSSGLKLYCPFTKSESEKGVEFVTKVKYIRHTLVLAVLKHV